MDAAALRRGSKRLAPLISASRASATVSGSSVISNDINDVHGCLWNKNVESFSVAPVVNGAVVKPVSSGKPVGRPRKLGAVRRHRKVGSFGRERHGGADGRLAKIVGVVVKKTAGKVGPKYQEIVNIRLGDGTTRRGQVLEVDGEKGKQYHCSKIKCLKQEFKLECMICLCSSSQLVSLLFTQDEMDYVEGPNTEFQRKIRLSKHELMGSAASQSMQSVSPKLYDHLPLAVRNLRAFTLSRSTLSLIK